MGCGDLHRPAARVHPCPIGAPPPTVIPGAEHLTPVNSPAAVTAAVLRLIGLSDPGGTARGSSGPGAT
ncbi:hypothetical protein EFY87_18815 [Flexivirga caeni]|uniref:Uncharacterized protein n=1 Tax=Flexivirga caeni TaxID=2294115 RepID=A0A3M9M035_9MICO|nr:hypothetical protein EFY87_18815 [Flexivirga caeni]